MLVAMIWIILMGVLAALLWYTCVRPLSYWKKLGVKQSPNPLPVLGDSWLIAFRRTSWCEFVEYLYNMYPNTRYSGFYQFSKPTLLIRDLELIKNITVKDFDHFVDHRGFVDPEADPLWGNNLFALTGQRWREMRATLSGSFTSSKMKGMFNLMAEEGEKFVQFFKDKNEEIVEVELKDAYTRYTNDIIATTAFGIKVDSLNEPTNVFYMLGNKITNFNSIKRNFAFFGYIMFPTLFKFLKVELFDREDSEYFKKIIDETIKSREEQGIVRPDMINLLLNARKGVKNIDDKETMETGFATVKESSYIGQFKQCRNITNEEIMSQAFIFFFGGFDAISTGMCMGSYELALNKDVQDKLREEVKSTHESNNGKLTYEILMSMKYMDMFISEIFRKWPPAVEMDRLVTKEYTINPITPDEKPLTLKQGDIVWIPVQGIQRDPAYYPNPTKFDPERFSDENKDLIKPYTYLAFGSGPRNCIGSRFALLEIKVLLYHLILNFEIVPTKKSPIPLKLNRKSFNYASEIGFWFGLKRLNI